MSKTQAPAKSIASKKVVPVKKGVPVKADSKAIKKAKSAVPKASSTQSSAKTKEDKKKVKKLSPQDAKTAQVKKATDLKEKENKKQVMPKKALTPYFAFLGSRRENFKADNPTLSVTELAKGLGQVWAALTEDQKQPYHKMVQDDVARYNKELKDLKTKGYFINQKGENSKDLQKAEDKKRAMQNALQPKKPLSAYMFYNLETYPSVKAKNPDLKITEISKVIGEQWSKLKENEKTKWTNLSTKDKARHDKELNQLQSKGYFINSDGVKSTEIVQKKFKYPEGTVMPKRPAQPYQIYVKDNKQKIVDKNKCTSDEAKQICDQVWQKLSEKQKAKYVTLHEKDVKRYEKQVLQLQTKGYFELEDGSRSQ